MALHHTLAEHNADPPAAWRVEKQRRPGREWNLVNANGTVLDAFPKRKAAEAARHSGFFVKLYAEEGRQFARQAEVPVEWGPSRDVKGLQGSMVLGGGEGLGLFRRSRRRRYRGR